MFRLGAIFELNRCLCKTERLQETNILRDQNITIYL